MPATFNPIRRVMMLRMVGRASRRWQRGQYPVADHGDQGDQHVEDRLCGRFAAPGEHVRGGDGAGPRQKGDRQGRDRDVVLAHALGELLGRLPHRRLLGADHVERGQQEHEAAGDLEGGQGDPEQAEDRGSKQGEGRHYACAGDTCGAGHEPPLFDCVVGRQREEGRDRREWVHDREEGAECQECIFHHGLFILAFPLSWAPCSGSNFLQSAQWCVKLESAASSSARWPGATSTRFSIRAACPTVRSTAVLRRPSPRSTTPSIPCSATRARAPFRSPCRPSGEARLGRRRRGYRPSVTFIATSNIVLHNRMVPVFADVDP